MCQKNQERIRKIVNNTDLCVLDSIEKIRSIAIKEHSNYVYRGLSRDDQLFPTILRNIPKAVDNNIRLYERKIYEDYCKYSIQYLPYYAYPEDFLASAQHYGLPTRLLDWTSNFNIALFFACSDNTIDSYIIKAKKEYIIDSLLQFPTDTSSCQPLDNRLRLLFNNMDYFDNETKKGNIYSQKPQYGQEYIIKTIQKSVKDNSMCFLKTHDANPRIVAQQGLFEFCKIKPNSTIEQIKSEHLQRLNNTISSMYKIPQKQKLEFMSYLKSIGITSASIFLDLENICKFIKDDNKNFGQ